MSVGEILFVGGYKQAIDLKSLLAGAACVQCIWHVIVIHTARAAMFGRAPLHSRWCDIHFAVCLWCYYCGPAACCELVLNGSDPGSSDFTLAAHVPAQTRICSRTSNATLRALAKVCSGVCCICVGGASLHCDCITLRSGLAVQATVWLRVSCPRSPLVWAHVSCVSTWQSHSVFI